MPAKNQPEAAKKAEKSPLIFPAEEMEKTEPAVAMDASTTNPDAVPMDMAALMKVITDSAATAAAHQQQQTKAIEGIAKSSARTEDLADTSARAIAQSFANLEARMIERETKAQLEVMAKVEELDDARKAELENFKEEMREEVKNLKAQFETYSNDSSSSDAYRAILLKEVREARFKIMMHGFKGRTGLEGVKTALREVLHPSDKAWDEMKVIQVHRLGRDPEKVSDRISPVVIEMGSIADTKRILELASGTNRAGGIFLKKFIPQEYMNAHSDFTSYGMTQRNFGMEWDITFCEAELQLHLRTRPNRNAGIAPGEWVLRSTFTPPAKPAKCKEENAQSASVCEEAKMLEATAAKQVILSTDIKGKVGEPDKVAGEVLKNLKKLALLTHPPGEELPAKELPQSWSRGQILLTCRSREDAKKLTTSFKAYSGLLGRRVDVKILLPDTVMTPQ